MNTLTQSNATTEPAIYVSTYRQYSEGSLYGKWISLEGHTAESFYKECRSLFPEADPELMFQDYQGFPSQFYDECSLPDNLWEWLELDEDQRKLLNAYCEALGNSDANISDAEDSFCGCWESGADYAESTCLDDGMDLPHWLVIDWQATWNRNLRHDFYTHEDSEGIWLFHV